MMSSLAELEDHDLIASALGGQAESFTTLTDRHVAAVRRRVQVIVREDADVDDLIQEVLLKAWQHLSSFRAEATFRTWITRIAINEALQWYRRQRRRRSCPLMGDAELVESLTDTPHQIASRSEATSTVQRAIREMPLHHRQVLVLCDLEECSRSDAAQQLQLSLPALKTRLLRARLLLAATVRKSEIRGCSRARTRLAVPVNDSGR